MATRNKGQGKSPVQLDTRWVRQGELPVGGISAEDLKSLLPAATRAHRQLRVGRERGQLGFYSLASLENPWWKLSRQAARKLWKPGMTDLVVLGIGGSALGTRAIQQALAPQTIPGALSPAGPKAGQARTVRVLDNIDPATVLPVLEGLDPGKTLVNVVSKSGGTVETAAQLQLFAKKFKKSLGKNWPRHFVFTTDPEKGELRRLAEQEGILALDVPENVGGRFSVLSPVGLFPAALMGVDGAAMIRGADAMRMRCETAEVTENPAYFFAASHVILQEKQKISISVMMPYCDGLQLLGAWYSQLWAESLGKRKSRTGKVVRTGITPVVAVGATDQHSQLQLYLQGPMDKLVTLISPVDLGKDAVIPTGVLGKKSESDTAFLGEHRLGELLAAERDATKAALVRNGIPVLELRMPAVTAETLGELFAFFEIATVFAGELLGIDPMDQPAVEEGKRYANALMGREGFESLAAEVAPFRVPDKKFLL